MSDAFASIRINMMQFAVLHDYADGLYASEFDLEEVVLAQRIFELGDPLLTFILIELSDDTECDSIEVGAGRMALAKDDLDVCLGALAKLNEAILAKTQSA